MDRIKTRDLALGRWPRILRELGIPAGALSGRNGPCLFCKGKDRARFTDYQDKGFYYCNQCGTRDGLKLLMQYHGWPFQRAVQEVDRVLGVSSYVSLSKENYQTLLDSTVVPIPRATRDCAVWLKKYHPERLEPWLEKHPVEVRFWLETHTGECNGL